MSQIICGDAVEEMRKMGEASIDAIVTDPPYGLEFMGKEWDRLSGGFSDGKFKGFRFPMISGGNRNVKCPDCGKWIYDHPPRNCRCGGVERLKKRKMYEWHYAWAIEALRVAKPGAHLLASGGTRTFHRLVCAIEDAGWEIRDTIAWVYGSGFPKSHNLTEEWNGWGTGLKPAFEPITIARKPLIGTVEKNVLKYGTGALNIDECRMDGIPPSVPQPSFNSPSGKIYGFKCGEGRSGEMSQSTKGRWPANLIHDGSDEVLWLFPETGHGNFPPKRGDGHIFGRSYGTNQPERKTDSGSAARFFYCAKASRREREAGLESLPAVTYARSGGAQGAERRGEDEYLQNSIGLNRISKVKNNHPTVKPLALMRYLCRLVTPPGGTVLDPFAGSGTTGIAATLEGFNFVLIEKEPSYVKIAEKRVEFFSAKESR